MSESRPAGHIQFRGFVLRLGHVFGNRLLVSVSESDVDSLGDFRYVRVHCQRKKRLLEVFEVNEA